MSGEYAFRVGNRWLNTQGLPRLVNEPSSTSLERGLEVLSEIGVESALLIPARLIPNDPRAQLNLRRVCVITLAESAPAEQPPAPEAA